jgi:hypothetical protein
MRSLGWARQLGGSNGSTQNVALGPHWDDAQGLDARNPPPTDQPLANENGPGQPGPVEDKTKQIPPKLYFAGASGEVVGVAAGGGTVAGSA